MEWSRFPRQHDSGSIRWCSIVGAPRCGTTSLANYLSDHPDVCLSNVKEPHYFSRREFGGLSPDIVVRRVQEEYVEHFFPDAPEGSTMLDGSVSYLYAPERLSPATAMWPECKFVIAIRNPLEMLPSLHQRQVCNGDEVVLQFERAWDLVGERRLGRSIPNSCLDPRLLDYEEIGRLGKHVRRFVDVVGRERCFVSLFEDLMADPAGQYRRLLEFLGLPPHPRSDFGRCRSSAGVRSASLQRLLKRPPKVIRSLLASDAYLHRENSKSSIKPDTVSAARQLKRIRKRLLAWNRTEAPPRVLSGRLRSPICAVLEDDIADLSDLVGRDLSHWFQGDGPVAHTGRSLATTNGLLTG
jgi:hypothetical protein